MGCSMLFADIEVHMVVVWMVPLLHVHSVHEFLQAFLMSLDFPMAIFSLLGVAATLEVSLLPTPVTFSILGWAVLLKG